jgi:serine/threonine protein kinase
MTSLSSASTISHYKIREPIGSGGMGEVYKAVDLQLGRVVALKALLPLKATEPAAHQRFLREARAASILSHPSICTIYEIGEADDLTFIAMQYVEGKTVQEILSQGPLPLESALGYALDVADALHEAHRNGVIHRDIKPSNIIVNERDVAVVLDFGLAKQISFANALNEELPTLLELTSTTTLVGTAPYMPPEQILGETLDTRSDIFSFGVTFYEMLTGVRPFNSLHAVDVLHSILHDEPRPITEFRPDLDEGLAAIVGKALKKDKSERYESANEFRKELTRYIQSQGYFVRGVSSSPVSSMSVARVRAGALTRENLRKQDWLTRTQSLLPFALLILIAVGLVGGTWWFLSRARSSESNPLSLRHIQVINWKSEPGELGSDGVFSPDGRMIAFSSIRGKYRDIWIKQTKMGDANQITKGEWNSWNPLWSPDNQQIAFLSKRGNQSGIWRMPALGGVPTLIGGLGGSGNLRLRYWSKDGGTIYYELTPDLFALSVTSGQATRVTNFEATQHLDILNFSIAPKEDSVAYLDRKNGHVDIWSLPLQGGQPIQVTNDSPEDRNPVWDPDGRRIIYSSLRDGTYQICVAYIDGRPPVQVTSGESDKLVLDISADGTEILYAASREESDIWGASINAGEESEISSEPGVELWPDISPDGQTIAYQSISNPDQGNKLGDSLIVARPIGQEGQKLQLAAGGINPTWAPDGNRLAFLRSSGNIWNIWTVRATGGDEKQLTNRGAFVGFSSLPYDRVGNRFFSWSPDASKIAYPSQGTNESGMWVISADGSHETAISSNLDLSLYCPLWLPDSSGVAYLSKTNDKSRDRPWSIWLADLNANKYESIFQGTSAIRLLGWSGSASSLMVATTESQEITTTKPADLSLVLIPRKGGGGQKFATLRSAYLNNIQLSPDGRNIAFVARQDGKDNVWLISAKGGEARKLTSNTDPRLYFSSLAFSPDGQTIYFGKQSSSSLISMIENFK